MLKKRIPQVRINTAILQFEIEITEIPQEKLSNTANSNVILQSTSQEPVIKFLDGDCLCSAGFDFVVFLVHCFTGRRIAETEIYLLATKVR